MSVTEMPHVHREDYVARCNAFATEIGELQKKHGIRMTPVLRVTPEGILPFIDLQNAKEAADGEVLPAEAEAKT